MENYYEILGIPRDAAREEINRAFREKTKSWRPGKDTDLQEAGRMTSLLKEAYETLSNDIRRKEYDNLLTLNEYNALSSEGVGPASDKIAHFECEVCGRQDEFLGFSIFLYVFSLIVFTFKKGWGKVLCSKCKIKYSLLFNLEVLLFGWWGIPFGIIYSLEALGKNTLGGIRNKEYDAYILAGVGFEKLNNGDYKSAYRILHRSYRLHRNESVKNAIEGIRPYYDYQNVREPATTNNKIKHILLNLGLIIILPLVLFSGLDYLNNLDDYGKNRNVFSSDADTVIGDDEKEVYSLDKLFDSLGGYASAFDPYYAVSDSLFQYDLDKLGVEGYIDINSSSLKLFESSKASSDSIVVVLSNFNKLLLNDDEIEIFDLVNGFYGSLNNELKWRIKFANSLILWKAADYPNILLENTVSTHEDSLIFYANKRSDFAERINRLVE